jgi:predicted TIM-barrel fold metal-dependent hydrolase
MGRPEPGRPHADGLVECVRDGVCFVKLSAPYRISAEAPPWRDVTPLAHALLSANAGACVWASDWPHTQMAAGVSEDDLFAVLDEWCPEQRTKRIIMEEAPRALHGVAPA